MFEIKKWPVAEVNTQLAFILSEDEDWRKKNIPHPEMEESITAEEQAAIISELEAMGAVRIE